jgi:hypothetical protein
LNGRTQSDVGAEGRSSLISGDFAKNPAPKANKKMKFFLAAPGATTDPRKSLKNNLCARPAGRNSSQAIGSFTFDRGCAQRHFTIE